MLFAILMKNMPGLQQKRITARLEWEYPEGGAKPVAEYWLQIPDPSVIIFAEADNIGQIWAVVGRWQDLFEITVVPAIDAQEGLPILRQMVQG